jgi:UDP-glucuronate 4-epimerase
MKINNKYKILITGAAGFIGFHLTSLLVKKGFFVIGLDNLNSYYDRNLKLDRLKEIQRISKKKFKFYKVDISSNKKLQKIFKKEKIDIVINLAAQAGVRYSLENPSAYIKSNLLGFFNILQLSKDFDIKHLVYASTSSVYGMNKKLPFSENQGVNHPLQLYAATKRSNELMAHAYSNLYKLPTTGLRFFTVYGPWGRPDMALFLFVKNILSFKPIKVFNRGMHMRDFTYVDDIANGIYKVIFKIPKQSVQKSLMPNSSNAPFRILNIGNSKKVKLLSFIKEIENNLKIKAKKKYFGLQKGDVVSTFSDTKGIKKLTNYKSKTSYKLGIKKFIQWYKKYYEI